MNFFGKRIIYFTMERERCLLKRKQARCSPDGTASLNTTICCVSKRAAQWRCWNFQKRNRKYPAYHNRLGLNFIDD